ncbi:MAG: DUF3052 domain-containing protein [Bifidobacteriaceae bacterium]|nr:DUF3052 domain-containing protein [Bifidobacteriaceae bacterium]
MVESYGRFVGSTQLDGVSPRPAGVLGENGMCAARPVRLALDPMISPSNSQIRGRSEGPALGLANGQVVQEFGYDDDVDFDLRDAVEDAVGAELVDEDWDDVTDVAMIWWRDGDGDLTDQIVDALTPLEDGGLVWVLTPKPGRRGHVEPSEILEAADIAGLHATTTVSVGKDWAGTRLQPRGRSRR